MYFFQCPYCEIAYNISIVNWDFDIDYCAYCGKQKSTFRAHVEGLEKETGFILNSTRAAWPKLFKEEGDDA